MPNKKEDKMEKIKPCPFCGSKKVEVNRTNENACWISCIRCAAQADSKPARKDAIKLWNKRSYCENYADVLFDMDQRND